MNLARELRTLVTAYVEGESALGELRDWLAAHVAAIDEGDDTVVRDLADRVWILIAEFDYGHRDEDGIREALADLLGKRSSLTRRQGPLSSTPR